jgi:dephospho-CoA kinase
MIIGITGWFAGGKDTVAEYLVGKKGFQMYSLSDIIRDHLRAEGKEFTRENLQKKGNELRNKYGAGYLAEQALEKCQKEGTANAVIPAVRQMGEVKALRARDDFQLWEIAAPARLRYERLLIRARSEDEKKITFEEFLAKEQSETSTAGTGNCQQLDLTTAAADQVIDNSGTFLELYAKVDKILGKVKND